MGDMQVYPERYLQLELTAEERAFTRTLQRLFAEEDMAYYVLHINPRKKSANGVPELFSLLLLPQGLFLFRFFPVSSGDAAQVLLQSFSSPVVYGTLETELRSQLEKSRYLTDPQGKLQHAMNVCFVLPNIDSNQLEGTLSDQAQTFCREHVLFQDQLSALRKSGPQELLRRLPPAEPLREELVNNVFQRLCPELTIPRVVFLDETASIQARDGELTSRDRAVQSYRLDNQQINLVNRLTKGNQLILACAGSGKSVLLISKCFKLASLNPDQTFLITCYNRNLYHYYQWAIAQAGFTHKNVRCLTFYGLCKHLLDRNRLPSPTQDGLRHGTPEYYTRLFDTVNTALAEGKITDRFYGIFIDEVQIFKPEWYRFCFNLLSSKNADDHVFVIAGDKSQDIKNNIKKGTAPWQGGGAQYPEYRGKTLHLKTNYRNSRQINQAVQRFVEEAKQRGAAIGADLASDPELFLLGESTHDGPPPRLVEPPAWSNQGEEDAVCAAIRHLLEVEGLSEVDIAVLFYNRRTRYTPPGWSTDSYEFFPDLEERFQREGWQPPTLLTSGESAGATYGSRTGVTFATIEGSLGLDFRAVILAGLRPLGGHERAVSLHDFLSFDDEKEQEQKQEAFVKNVNFLYTGCTRAKDHLVVVLSAQKGANVYMDLLRASMGGEAGLDQA